MCISDFFFTTSLKEDMLLKKYPKISTFTSEKTMFLPAVSRLNADAGTRGILCAQWMNTGFNSTKAILIHGFIKSSKHIQKQCLQCSGSGCPCHP